MATPNYEMMAQDLALLLHKWEQEGQIDIVNNPDEILAGAMLLVPTLSLAIRWSSRLKRR